MTLDSVDESIIGEGISFDKERHRKESEPFSCTPDDSDDDGRLLRIYQQYFMVSAGAQLIHSVNVHPGAAITTIWLTMPPFRINDTHPSMVIPELIRLLELHGIEFEEAVQIVTDTCAYTNHRRFLRRLWKNGPEASWNR